MSSALVTVSITTTRSCRCRGSRLVRIVADNWVMMPDCAAKEVERLRLQRLGGDHETSGGDESVKQSRAADAGSGRLEPGGSAIEARHRPGPGVGPHRATGARRPPRHA